MELEICPNEPNIGIHPVDRYILAISKQQNFSSRLKLLHSDLIPELSVQYLQKRFILRCIIYSAFILYRKQEMDQWAESIMP